MISKFGSVPLTALLAILSACSTPPPKNPPGQVRVSFEYTPQDDSTPKHLTRGAVSGVPQRVGFYYSVNPDCTSDGLVQLQLKDPPKHGSVVFSNEDGYTNVPSTSPGHECNSKKSPGVRVVYTSETSFVGTDEFTVQGIGPHGKYMVSDYAVNVIAP
jgi:hypothetical protein